MDRAEATGLGIAVVGHGALLAALTLGLAGAVAPPMMNPPMDVSFVDEIGLQSAVPEPATEAPMASVAPETGAPEEAAPKAVEAPPVPDPVIQPKTLPKATSEPASSKAATKPAPPKALPKTSASNAKANSGKGKAEATKGSRLGSDFLKGLGDDAKSTSNKPTGAVMSAQALAGIQQAIQRQIQPCANRQADPGPGANQIKVTINLRLDRNGSLARRPTVVRTSGVDDENRRYEERVKDLAIAAYTGCSPLRGLPEDLYQTPKGGWSNINMTYKLP
ncbi:hypothetical protein IC614_10435 [Allosphingosinicella flava]|uniref:Cell envelope biogenesis protein TolA n=1 Tax=Allosphingosinicella flava TaxID=2771430 RepID=A0A7T2GIY1_9SPHN|nr:hypothetical protein [Sphingosinicella flava]QPQ54734.1 hypothetical protein IC614_10435 [Sphingosinicella flava]